MYLILIMKLSKIGLRPSPPPTGKHQSDQERITSLIEPLKEKISGSAHDYCVFLLPVVHIHLAEVVTERLLGL